MAKLVLRIAGGLALLVGVAIVIFGGVEVSRLPSGAESDALIDAINSIAIGALGALLGAGLIVYAGLASKRDA